MLISRNWLQEYIEEELPEADMLAERLGFHSFEVEGVHAIADDHILDIDVLPNRAHDALSYLGMAMEVASIFSFTFRMPPMSFQTSDFSTSDYIILDVENHDLVPRVMKKIVRGVKVDESPGWLKARLEAMGQKSINNIVDITNFVMYEFGQPVHAFDFGKVAKDTEGKAHIHIRGAREGEKIQMLDGKEFTLNEGMLVIADREKALDIAGIKGSISSSIDENTETILISVCNFNASNIRRTSKILDLRTDASTRFEKDIAPEIPPSALHRICHLIGEFVEGEEISKDFLDVYPKPLNQYIVGVTTERIHKILGTPIPESDIEKILLRLGFVHRKLVPVNNVLSIAKDYIGKPYLYGASIRRDAPNSFDCSSFVAYLYAISGIHIPRISIDQYAFCDSVEKSAIQPGDLIFSNSEKGNIWHETQEYMTGTPTDIGVDHVGMYLGNGEVVHSSRYKDGVVSETLKDSEQFSNIVAYGRVPKASKERYIIEVPFYRLDIRREEDLIEEIGRVHGYENIPENEPYSGHGPVHIHKEFYWTNKIKDILVQNGFSEVYNYSFVEKGERELENALAENKNFLRSTLSDGVTTSVLGGSLVSPLLGVEKVRVFEIGTVFDKDGEFIHLYFSDDGVFETLEKEIGNIGPEARMNDGAINITKLIKNLPNTENYDDLVKISFGEKKFEPLSPYPFVLRDIAIWVPNEVKSNKVLKVIKEKAGEWFVNSNLFDKFEKDGQISYAFRLVFQSHKKTLTDEEVNKVMKNITVALNSHDSWEVR